MEAEVRSHKVKVYRSQCKRKKKTSDKPQTVKEEREKGHS